MLYTYRYRGHTYIQTYTHRSTFTHLYTYIVTVNPLLVNGQQFLVTNCETLRDNQRPFLINGWVTAVSQRESFCMTRKLNCSTRYSLVGTRRIITLRGLLVDCSQSEKGSVRKDGTTSEHSSTRAARIRLPGRAVQYRTSEVRTRLRDSPVKKTDTADRQNTTGEGTTENNPGSGLEDRR
jgi:hypothetical protein